jgi:hypothetical protein
VTDQPEIPDSISSSELSALLGGRNKLPLSTIIPSLDFGGAHGGACDLQFAINQMIVASGGVNIVQVLCAAMHLIQELDCSFEGQLENLRLQREPYDKATDEERFMMERYITQNRRGLHNSMLHLESVIAVLMPPFANERISHLRKLGGIQRSVREFRSQLLISDELLRDLEIDRDAVTDYLDAAAS